MGRLDLRMGRPPRLRDTLPITALAGRDGRDASHRDHRRHRDQHRARMPGPAQNGDCSLGGRSLRGRHIRRRSRPGGHAVPPQRRDRPCLFRRGRPGRHPGDRPRPPAVAVAVAVPVLATRPRRPRPDQNRAARGLSGLPPRAGHAGPDGHTHLRQGRATVRQGAAARGQRARQLDVGRPPPAAADAPAGVPPVPAARLHQADAGRDRRSPELLDGQPAV